MTPTDQLTSLARALYGARWQRATAAALGIDPKQVRRWASGHYEPTSRHLEHMAKLAKQRQVALREALLTWATS